MSKYREFWIELRSMMARSTEPTSKQQIVRPFIKVIEYAAYRALEIDRAKESYRADELGDKAEKLQFMYDAQAITLKQCEVEYDELYDAKILVNDENLELQAEIERLKMALKKYGVHDMSCTSEKCICGFEDAINLEGE